jgi:hypothetical protein
MKTDMRRWAVPERMRPAGRLVAVLALALACAAPALAADYEVEVIVFRHAGSDAGQWAASQPLPDFSATRRLADDAGAGALHPLPAFVRLPATMHRLAGAEKLLARAGAYEVLSHEVWRQPDSAVVPVYLADSAAGVPTAGESGGVAPIGPRAEGSVTLQVAKPQLRVLTDFVVMASDTPVRVRTARNLRPGELHYLDHELLGILLQVTEVLAPLGAAPASVAPATEAPVSD